MCLYTQIREREEPVELFHISGTAETFTCSVFSDATPSSLTNLDSWQLIQPRRRLVATVLPLTSSRDMAKKYSSRMAELYKAVSHVANVINHL